MPVLDPGWRGLRLLYSRMSLPQIQTIDTHYTEQPEFAAAYLLEDRGELAFVETNTSAALPRLLAALERSGATPAQVRYVIVTHIHLDHAGGAGALMAVCPEATLLAHPRAAPHAVDPARIIAGARKVYGDEVFAQLYGEVLPVAAERVRALEDGARVELGGRELSFLHTRGHANHHFCVHDEQASAVFTGDAFGLLYPALQRGEVLCLASTTPTDFDAEAAHESVDRVIATGATRIFPTHFGEHRELERAAAQLHRQLDRYAAIVDEADSSGRAQEELDRYCLDETEALITRELDEVGLGGEASARALLDVDIRLNAQGLAFAVQKRRYKRSK